jgi:hypothetical protein
VIYNNHRICFIALINDNEVSAVDNLLENAFDFSISVTEMVKYLKDDNKGFPLSERLLDCGTGICLSLRAAHTFPKTARDSYEQAARQVLEFQFLMELMVKTGSITDLQSRPLLMESNSIMDGIAGLPAVSSGSITGSVKNVKKW